MLPFGLKVVKGIYKVALDCSPDMPLNLPFWWATTTGA